MPKSASCTASVGNVSRPSSPARKVYPLVGLCAAAGLPTPTPEYRFHPERMWRLDYAWPERMVAVEIEGGIFVAGRHSRGAGMLGDMAKYNAATLLGWRLLRYSPAQLTVAVADLRMLFSVLAAAAPREYAPDAGTTDRFRVSLQRD